MISYLAYSAAANDEMQFDTGNAIAIIAAISVVCAGIFSGFWRWIAARKKNGGNIQQIMNGFILLLGEFKKEREVLAVRIIQLEDVEQKLSRRVVQLERVMIERGIQIPKEL